MTAEEGEDSENERPAEAEAQRLLKEEKAEYDADARRIRESAEGLLIFIDAELQGTGFTMPAFDDPHDATVYIAGIVEIRRTAQDIRHRRRLVSGVARFTRFWIGVVVLIVFLSAIWPHFKISDNVLIVLLSTTTANVLGLAVIVLKGMFEGDPPDHLRPLAPPEPPKI